MANVAMKQIRNIAPIFLDLLAARKGWGKSMYVLMAKPININAHPTKPYHKMSAPHVLRVDSITTPITFRINAVAGRYFFIAYSFLGVLIPCF